MAARLNEQHWVVLYDDACGFCRWVLSGLLRLDRRRRLRPLALQDEAAGALLSDLGPDERMASFHLVSPQGRRLSGGEGLPALLRLLSGGRAPAAALSRLPALSDRGYRWIAEHRSQLSRFVPRRAKLRAAERVREREAEPAAKGRAA
jgi:predicted DCC family thiol-disulfide oxidoreductase YuxK